jgi:hypothetical protein
VKYPNLIPVIGMEGNIICARPKVGGGLAVKIFATRQIGGRKIQYRRKIRGHRVIPVTPFGRLHILWGLLLRVKLDPVKIPFFVVQVPHLKNDFLEVIGGEAWDERVEGVRGQRYACM